ncbi:unnamed protein product [Chrysoparadoxa australica]
MVSTIGRCWDQLTDDLMTALSAVPVPDLAQPPAAEKGLNGDIGKGQVSDGAPLLQKLLGASGNLPVLDINDSAGCLKACGVELCQDAASEDGSLPDNDDDLLGDGAKCTQGDDGEGENGENQEVKLVEDALQRRCKSTEGILAQVLNAVQAALGSATEKQRSVSLEQLHHSLMAQRRKMTAELALLSDILTQSHAKRQKLSRKLSNAERQRHRAQKKLDRLAEAGVDIPEDMVAPGAGNGSVTATPAATTTTVATTGASGVDGGASGAVGSLDPSAGVSGACLGAAGAGQGESEGHSGTALSNGVGSELQGRISELEAVADARLKEIEQIRQERVEMQVVITKLKSRSGVAEGDGKAGSQEVTRLQSSLKLEREHCEQQIARAAASEQLLDGLRLKLRTAEVSHDKALEAQRVRWNSLFEENAKLLESEQEKLDVANRKLQAALDESKASEAIKETLAEYKSLLAGLESEVEQLKKGSDRAKAQCKILQERLNKSSAAEASLEEKLRAGPGAAAADGLAAAHERLKERLQEAEQELISHKEMEDAVLSEVDVTSQAYDEVKKQNLGLLGQLAARDKTIAQLNKEVARAKQNQELQRQEKGALELQARHGEEINSRVKGFLELAQERQSMLEAQLHEEQSKHLLAARELHEAKLHADRLHQAAQHWEQELGEKDEAVTLLQTRAIEFANKYEHESSEHRRAQEQVASCQRKLAKLNQKQHKPQRESSSSSDKDNLLHEEVKELRRMLRCSVCSTRQKNCVITKCFHLFCQHCVDENLRVMPNTHSLSQLSHISDSQTLCTLLSADTAPEMSCMW